MIEVLIVYFCGSLYHIGWVAGWAKASNHKPTLMTHITFGFGWPVILLAAFISGLDKGLRK